MFCFLIVFGVFLAGIVFGGYRFWFVGFSCFDMFKFLLFFQAVWLLDRASEALSSGRDLQ